MIGEDTLRLILQFVIGGIASWALREVYRLAREVDVLKATVAIHHESTTQSLSEIHAWMRDISKKIDRLIELERGEVGE